MPSKVYRVNEKNLIRQTTSNKKGAEVAPKFIASSFYQSKRGVSKLGCIHKYGQQSHRIDTLKTEGIF